MAAAQLFLCRKRALAALCLGLLHGEDEERRRKRNRKVYMRQWISRREERGVFHQLIRELEVGDVVAYTEFFRMTKEQFCFLLRKVSPLIQKKEQPTPINAVRATIQPDERLAVALRYLATGESRPRVSGLQLQTRLLRPLRPPCFFNLLRSRASMTANHKR